ncbi:Glycerol-3-phosphate transporter [Tupaia chinensis]|uniref:Glycerol-3-phosphate transporter n=1 Tax=Tupaia chinensis TaxID=246437 RepID=L9JVH0_TUPCH|nr:Glycerol-3-phosphate transporter [Tupaia chinensis]
MCHKVRYTLVQHSHIPVPIIFRFAQGELHKDCATWEETNVGLSLSSRAGSTSPLQLLDNETDCGWAPFDKNNYQQLLGALDYSFLCAYAIGMYLSGIIGERLPIRYYLTFGMLASGAFTALFGLGYFYNIHNLGFYVVTQVINGLVQTTGWPSVVTCLGNWFGKGRRGLIMGLWNSHTSVGNILGSLIAGYWVSTCWGLSFIVPGAIVAAMGIVCFLFLIEHPKDIKCSSTLPTPASAPVLEGADIILVRIPRQPLQCLVSPGATASAPPDLQPPSAIPANKPLCTTGTGQTRESQRGSSCPPLLSGTPAFALMWLHSKGYENGTNRFRLQKQILNSEKNRPLDPEMQCLLLSDGKGSIHPNHVVILPGDSGGGMAAISFIGALKIPGVVEFSLCLLFAKLVSYTFLFWLPLYITSVGEYLPLDAPVVNCVHYGQDHLDAKKAGELSTLFDVGGIFGGILAGVISDRLEKRASTCGLMLLLAAPTLYVFSTVSKMGVEATVAMLLLSGALVSGPYALITTAVSADLGTHKSLKGNSHALSTVTAIIDGTGSVGAAVGPLLAGLISPSGWSNVFYMLMFADACALLEPLQISGSFGSFYPP